MSKKSSTKLIQIKSNTSLQFGTIIFFHHHRQILPSFPSKPFDWWVI